MRRLLVVFLALGLVLGSTSAAWADRGDGRRERECRHQCRDRDGDDEGERCVGFIALCHAQIIPPPPGQPQPASLFPPSPAKIIAAFQAMADAGIALGTGMARLTVDFVTGLFKVLVHG